MNLHYTAHLKAREGIYHIRLYAFDYASMGVCMNTLRLGTLNTLRLHYGILQTFARDPIDITDEIIEVGKIHVAADNEIFQGVTEFDNFHLSIIAVPALKDVVEALRRRDTEVWVEVTLEQHVVTVPPYKTGGGLFWPRKTRSIFWGKANRPDVTGKVKRQGMADGRNWQIARKTPRHYGTLDLNFVHWLKKFGEADVKDFLDTYKALPEFVPAPNNSYTSAAKLLYHILAFLSPSFLFHASDYRMNGPDQNSFVPDRPDTLPNFRVPYKLTDGIFETDFLEGFQLYVKKTNVDAALFFNDPSGSNDQSLYGCKDFAELLFRFSQEFLLFPQVEIPTMEDAWAGPAFGDNRPDGQILFWPATTRWLFMFIESKGKPIYLDAQEDTIQYTPAATFARSYKVEMPSVNDLLPQPPYVVVTSDIYEGSDQGYKTLLRFAGQEWIGGGLVDSPRGWEITLFRPGLGPMFARSVIYAGTTYDSWIVFHADVRMNRWGGIRSTLELMSRTVGIEPFGASATVKNKPIKKITQAFGLHDWGEFPLFRTFNARVGLLVDNEKDLIEYSTYDIERTPNGDAALKMIETVVHTPNTSIFSGSNSPGATTPPSDVTPPIVTFHTPIVHIPSTTVAGTIVVEIAATDDVAIASVKLYIDAKFYDIQNFTGVSGYYEFPWATTGYTNGSHTLAVIAYDTSGKWTSATNTVNVSN